MTVTSSTLHTIDNETRQVKYQYNADGTIRRMEVGTGLVTEYTYDADKNVISQKTVMAGINSTDMLLGYRDAGTAELLNQQGREKSLAGNLTSIAQMNQRDKSKPYTLVDNTYAYDANGNRTRKQTLAGLTTYQYDAANRLVKADYPAGSEEYRYDKAGNRTERLVNGISAERYQYDSRNRLISQDIMSLRADGAKVSEHKEYIYDQQGNMLSDGMKNFTYDAMNRLSQVTNIEGHMQKNHYDGEGLRAEMEENGRLVSFLFDGDKVVAETECDGNVIRYIRGYELISSDSEKAKTYYHYTSDEMGSITHVTDEAGNVCNYYEYDAFGNFKVREESIPNRFGYTGEQYDTIADLYYLRARFYNPVIGRFTQEDTYYGDGLNLYSYCQNNPVGYVDPSGHDMCPKKQAAINELMEENGLTREQAENYYNSLRNQGGSNTKALYRGDRASVVPDDVFQNGFKPKGTYNDALIHTKSNTTAGNFVSTSADKAIATEFAGKNGYVYVIQTDNYVDINSAYGAGAYFPEQIEFAIPGGIKPSEIVGVYKKTRWKNHRRFEQAENRYKNLRNRGNSGSGKHHEMYGSISRDGSVIFEDNYISGGGKGGYRDGLLHHTERKFLSDAEVIVESGDHLNMIGELDPCRPGCQPAIRKFVQDNGVTVTYVANGTGKTFHWSSFNNSKLKGTVLQTVIDSNGNIVGRWRYWQKGNGR